MNQSIFRVSHHQHELGSAKLTEKRVTYTTDPKAFRYFESRPEEWLREFRKVVQRLCKSVGHTSKFSIATDIDSGITVERA